MKISKDFLFLCLKWKEEEKKWCNNVIFPKKEIKVYHNQYIRVENNLVPINWNLNITFVSQNPWTPFSALTNDCVWSKLNSNQVPADLYKKMPGRPSNLSSVSCKASQHPKRVPQSADSLENSENEPKTSLNWRFLRETTSPQLLNTVILAFFSYFMLLDVCELLSVN